MAIHTVPLDPVFNPVNPPTLGRPSGGPSGEPSARGLPSAPVPPIPVPLDQDAPLPPLRGHPLTVPGLTEVPDDGAGAGGGGGAGGGTGARAIDEGMDEAGTGARAVDEGMDEAGDGGKVDARWTSPQQEEYLAASQYAVSQAIGALLGALSSASSRDLFDLLLACRREAARRAAEAGKKGGRAGGMEGDSPIDALEEDGLLGGEHLWAKLLLSSDLSGFSEAQSLAGLKSRVEKLEKARTGESVTVDRVLSEVTAQLDMLEALRRTIMQDGELLVTDPSEVRGVVTAANSSLTLLVRFQEDLIDLKRVKSMEQALIDAARGLPPSAQQAFVDQLRESLEKVA